MGRNRQKFLWIALGKPEECRFCKEKMIRKTEPYQLKGKKKSNLFRKIVVCPNLDDGGEHDSFDWFTSEGEEDEK